MTSKMTRHQEVKALITAAIFFFIGADMKKTMISFLSF